MRTEHKFYFYLFRMLSSASYAPIDSKNKRFQWTLRASATCAFTFILYVFNSTFTVENFDAINESTVKVAAAAHEDQVTFLPGFGIPLEKQVLVIVVGDGKQMTKTTLV